MLNFDYFLMKDNMDLFDYNVQDRVDDFVAAALSQVSCAFLQTSELCMITSILLPHLVLFSGKHNSNKSHNVDNGN